MEPAQLEKVAVAVHGAELPVALCSSVVHDLDRNCSAVSVQVMSACLCLQPEEVTPPPSFV